MWNLERLLSVTGDDRELQRELINLFLVDTASRLANLPAAIEAGNIDHLRLQAHAVKGASANMGADRLQEACAKMESAALSGDAHPFEKLYEEVDVEFDRVKEFCTRYLATIAAE